MVNTKSDRAALKRFFLLAHSSDEDNFMNQNTQREVGEYPRYSKQAYRPILGFKTTRHFEMVEHYLQEAGDIVRVVAVIRNPFAAINSWIKTDREFSKKGCMQKDWLDGKCRKGEVGEYWGFQDWAWSTRLFLRLSGQYGNIMMLRYEDLVFDAVEHCERLFSYLDIDITAQTRNFLAASQRKDLGGPYSVFRTRNVVNRWRTELSQEIVSSIEESAEWQELKWFFEGKI
jgi:hypothetical protein